MPARSSERIAQTGETSGANRRKRQPKLRLAETPSQLYWQAHRALVGRETVDPAELLALRRYFRRCAQETAKNGGSFRRIMNVVRQAPRPAPGNPELDSVAAAHVEALIQALGSAAEGYVRGRVDQPSIRRLDNALQVLEEERRRLARELHDETAQLLTAVLFQLDAGVKEVPSSATGAVTQLNEARATLLAATRDLHHLVYRLHPPILAELGLVSTLRWLLRQWEIRYNATAAFTAPEAVQASPDVALAIYRIAQEGLTNVARHAQARTVRMQLTQTARHVELTIQDDGKGFDPNQMPQGELARLGLNGLRERALSLGGHLTIDSAPKTGTRLHVVLPVQHGRSKARGAKPKLP